MNSKIPATGFKFSLPALLSFALLGAILGSAKVDAGEKAKPVPGKLPPALMSSLVFVAFEVGPGPLSSKRIKELMNQKLKIGADGDDAYDFLRKEASFDCKECVHAETVSQYVAAINNGACAMNTFEMSMESFFIDATDTLTFLDRAKPSHQSLMGRSNLLDLSVSFLSWQGCEEENRLKQHAAAGFSLRDYQKAGTITKVKFGKDGRLGFEFGAKQYAIHWMARGDEDDDGLEDRLISVAQYNIGGNGRYYISYMVTKKKTKQPSLTVSDFTAFTPNAL